jgi:hypothetical protein
MSGPLPSAIPRLSALMQQKAVWSVLLRRFEFALAPTLRGLDSRSLDRGRR